MKVEESKSVAIGLPELCDNWTCKAKCKYSMYHAHRFVFSVKDTLKFCYLMLSFAFS